MSAALLEIAGLTVGFRGRSGEVRPVLRDVSLSLGRGERLGIVGESGCGKSTLALALLGFLRPGGALVSGAVRLGGEDLFGMRPDALQRLRGRRVALVPQNAGQSLTPSMRVGGQIAEALAAHLGLGVAAARARAAELLGLVRLPDPAAIARRYPHELSGGQQQRVAIALALAGQPELLVLDEPTTGLDVTTQAHILDLLDDVGAQSGAAMVYVSHDLGVIARASDRLAVMYAGQVVEYGATAELFPAQAHPYTRGLLASVPRIDSAALPGAMAGLPPPVGAPVVGCAFAPRCAFADDRCRAEGPALLALEDVGLGARAARCHHAARVLGADSAGLTQARPARAVADTPLLRVDDLRVSYARPGLAALARRLRGGAEPPPTVSEISLSLRPGETLALVGESGSGKSTVARTVAGLWPPLGGELRLGEHDIGATVERRPLELRRRVQMIFQNPDASLNPRHTVGEILDRPQRIFFGGSRAERAGRSAALLDRMRLGEDYLRRYPAQLSGGEKQRVAIARAFVARPDLVLCDEVVSALDVSVQAAVLGLLAELQAERQVAYLFISHDLAVVRAIADQVAVLYRGRICEVGTAEQVYAPPFHPYTASLLAAAPRPAPGQRPRPLGREAAAAGPAARGCPFAHRCPLRIGPVCDEVTPPWRELGGHRIRCHIDLIGAPA